MFTFRFRGLLSFLGGQISLEIYVLFCVLPWPFGEAFNVLSWLFGGAARFDAKVRAWCGVMSDDGVCVRRCCQRRRDP